MSQAGQNVDASGLSRWDGQPLTDKLALVQTPRGQPDPKAIVYLFIKAGVMLLDLHSAKLRQGELDLEPLEAEDCTRERLMGVLDELNQRYGRGTVKLASAGIQAQAERASWAMRQERRSPAYTTCWDEMLEVGC